MGVTLHTATGNLDKWLWLTKNLNKPGAAELEYDIVKLDHWWLAMQCSVYGETFVAIDKIIHQTFLLLYTSFPHTPSQ